MRKEIAEKWVSALRSGEYSQTTGMLVEHDGDNGDIVGYCCLGVLCELAIKDGADVEYYAPKRHFYDDDREDPYWVGAAYDGADALLPASVMAWSGVRTNDGGVNGQRGERGYISLSSMNDDGASFVELASFIEKHYEEL